MEDVKLTQLLVPCANTSDPRFDPAYEALRAEVQKLENPSAGAVDWTRVEKDGEAFLRDRSKDLLVGCYVTHAWHVNAGLPGLARGLALLSGLAAGHWDVLSPARPRAKSSAIDWLVSRLDVALPNARVGEKDRETVAQLVASARQLEGALAEKLGDASPSLRPLHDHFERARLALPVAKAVQAFPDNPNSVPVVVPAMAAPSLDASDLGGYLGKVGASLIQAANVAYRASSADPVAYRLRRVGAYLQIEKAPAAQGVRTEVPSPAALIAQLDTMLAHKAWAGLLEEAETAVSVHRFALDLHRYVAVALEGLGYGPAHAVVIAETRALLARLPELATLQHADGRPFASEATRTLFAMKGASTSQSEASTHDDANQLAAEGKLEQAIDSLAKSVAATSSGRERFRLRLQMARLCAASGNNLAAESLFAGLAAEVDAHGLDQWEPALAAELFALRHESLKALGKEGKDVARERTSTLVRLGRVAPDLAARCAS